MVKSNISECLIKLIKRVRKVGSKGQLLFFHKNKYLKIKGPSYCIVGMMRSGSNFLQSVLDANLHSKCYGEIFNQKILIDGAPVSAKHYVNDDGVFEQHGLDQFFSKFTNHSSGNQWGFRIFRNHNVPILNALLKSKTVKIIILKRNLLEAYCSLLNAKENKQWRLTNENRRVPALKKIKIDIEEFINYCDANIEFYKGVLEKVERYKSKVIIIDYQNLVSDDEELNRLTKFLGLGQSLKHTDASTLKQIKKPIKKLVSNYSAVFKVMEGMEGMDSLGTIDNSAH